MPAPTPAPVSPSTQRFRSMICPHDCDSCAWGIGGSDAKAGSDQQPLISKELLDYHSECGHVTVVLTGANQVGAIHRGRYYAGERTPELSRILTNSGLMALA